MYSTALYYLHPSSLLTVCLVQTPTMSFLTLPTPFVRNVHLPAYIVRPPAIPFFIEVELRVGGRCWVHQLILTVFVSPLAPSWVDLVRLQLTSTSADTPCSGHVRPPD